MHAAIGLLVFGLLLTRDPKQTMSASVHAAIWLCLHVLD